MAIYRGARKYAVTMVNLEISTGNQNLDLETMAHEGEPRSCPSGMRNSGRGGAPSSPSWDHEVVFST